jgi:Na+-transporting NADH:ubiquinone oxidoreductase subunit NqrB
MQAMQTNNLLNDARHYQIIFLSSFLIFGVAVLSWQANFINYLVIVSIALSTQLVANYLFNLHYSNLKSALITSLGLCILLKTNNSMAAAFAAFVAIASKFIITYQGKHIFNPANIGVVITVLLSQHAWISPGQWGSHAYILFAVGTLGFIVSSKAKSIDVALAFIITLIGLQYIRTVLYLGWPTDHWVQQFNSGSLLLFTFFMITDPATVPNNKWVRLAWAMAVAVLAFYLSNFMFIPTAPIYALFILGFTTPALNYLSQKNFSIFTLKNKKQYV